MRCCAACSPSRRITPSLTCRNTSRIRCPGPFTLAALCTGPGFVRDGIRSRPLVQNPRQKGLNRNMRLSVPRYIRLVLLTLALGSTLALGGCSTFNGLFGGDSKSDKEPEYVERPIDRIYNDAWKRITDDDWEGAAKQFDEVERQHPYSVWARRAMLMSAYCYYEANKYQDAISAADNYIALHPGSHEVAY